MASLARLARILWQATLLLCRALARSAAAVARVIQECNRAQRRLSELRLSPDRYLDQPDQAPDTYAEFLFRTSGPLEHEPPASKRARGRPSRR